MTPEQQQAVRKCAEWVGWEHKPAWNMEPMRFREYSADGYDHIDRDLNRHTNHCVLWEACRAKLCRDDLQMGLETWWMVQARMYVAERTPLENLKALAEVLP